jgi:hypothetical protein
VLAERAVLQQQRTRQTVVLGLLATRPHLMLIAVLVAVVQELAEEMRV